MRQGYSSPLLSDLSKRSGIDEESVSRLLGELGLREETVARLGLADEFRNLQVGDLRISARIGKATVAM